MIRRRARSGLLPLWVCAGISLALATNACGDDDGDGDDGVAGRSGGRGGVAGSGGRAGSDSTAGRAGGGTSSGGSGGGTQAGSGGAAGETAGGAAGETAGGAAGETAGGSAGETAGGAAGSAGETAGGSGGAGDVAVFRPADRPFSKALLEELDVAEGFELNVFAGDLGHARMLAVHGEDVYLTRPMQGDVLLLRDANEDGEAEAPVTAASGLPGVHGIVFKGDTVYLATVKEVHRGAVGSNGVFGELEEIISDLPDGGQHPNRTLGIGPDSSLYISIGSSCDACAETNPEHATILRASLDGTTRSVFARGLRNTIGFGWHPVTSELWGFDHGSDFRGNDVPPEELNLIESGKNHGWPYCYGNRIVDPIIDDPPNTTKAEWCAQTTGPILSFQAHSAPIGLTFAATAEFPAEYQDDAFVAMRGSWNRFPPTGYKIARVRFEAGDPVAVEDFVSGFLIEDGAANFGRLAGITIAPDGALLFSDDTNGMVYRVRYAGP